MSMSKHEKMLLEMKLILDVMYKLKSENPEEFRLRLKALCLPRQYILRGLIQQKELESNV